MIISILNRNLKQVGIDFTFGPYRSAKSIDTLNHTGRHICIFAAIDLCNRMIERGYDK